MVYEGRYRTSQRLAGSQLPAGLLYRGGSGGRIYRAGSADGAKGLASKQGSQLVAPALDHKNVRSIQERESWLPIVFVLLKRPTLTVDRVYKTERSGTHHIFREVHVDSRCGVASLTITM